MTMIIYIIIFVFVFYAIAINISIRSKEKERALRLEKERALKQAIDQERALKEKSVPTTNDAVYIRNNNTHTIKRYDNKPISDDEVPDLIKLGYQEALERERQSTNIKFHRTEREEDLMVQFMMNHSDQISKHTDSFEELYRLAFDEDDLNKKIELLQKTIIQFEKEKAWFYRTKGGTIYFQDMYEHMHNSRDDDFSYISQVKNYLEECIKERDYIIPTLLDIIQSSDGILQKDIYQHMPDVSRADVQRTIRDFESEGLITREKSKGSYLITYKGTK